MQRLKHLVLHCHPMISWIDAMDKTPSSKRFTMHDIKASIKLMRARYESGQGTLASAMCRLSLPMAESLVGHVQAHRSLTSALAALCSQVNEYRDAIGHYLSATGACDDAQDGYSLCSKPSCAYCMLAATVGEVNDCDDFDDSESDLCDTRE